MHGHVVELGTIVAETPYPTLLVALRHFGCLLCARTMAHVLSVTPRLVAVYASCRFFFPPFPRSNPDHLSGVQIVVVGLGTAEMAKQFKATHNFEGMLVFSSMCNFHLLFLLSIKADSTLTPIATCTLVSAAAKAQSLHSRMQP